MTKTKFTKGPWEVNTIGSEVSIGTLSTLGDQSYGMMSVISWLDMFDCFSEGEQMANAHLIAAAPEMYSLLEKIQNGDAGFVGYDMYPIIRELLEKARGE